MLHFITLMISVLCLLGCIEPIQADPLNSFVPNNEEVQVQTLPNGMTLLVHERLLAEEGVSLRLVWNPPSDQHRYTGWDVSDSTLRWTEEFFQECRNDLRSLPHP